jgi:hypothetical protein
MNRRRDEGAPGARVTQTQARSVAEACLSGECVAEPWNAMRGQGTYRTKPRVALEYDLTHTHWMPAHRETSRLLSVAPAECSVLFRHLLPISLARPYHAALSIPT